MNKIILFLLFIFTSIISQSQSWNWAIHGGGTTSDKGTAIVTDSAGYSYVTGYFNEEADFGSFHLPLIDLHSKEVFIAKIDPAGNYVWVKRGSNHYDDRGLGICLDHLGNVFVTGTCWGGIIFEGLSEYNATSYTDQIFVVKLDNNGNFIWLKNAGNNDGDDHGHDVVCDKQGNIYVTGFISNWSFGCNFGAGTATFGSHTITLPNPCDSLGFVAKLSPNGVWQWAKGFGGADASRDNRIAIDSSANIYISGGFTQTKTFGSATAISTGGTDIFITKYDKNGNFQFVKTVGGILDDRANDITVDRNNDIFVTGEFRDQLTFGTDNLNNYGGASGRDIFVAKMKTDGTWKWATKAGSSSGSDRGCGIVSNKKSNIFVTGQFKGNAKFGSAITVTTTVTDSVQVFLAAIDTSGNWKWAIQGGGMDEERGNSVGVDTLCNAYVTGYYSLGVNFGASNLTNYGKKDVFVTKVINPCFEYTVPTTPTITPTPSLTVVECVSEIPNVFSPNNDLKNDTWFIKHANCISSINLTIYNRWGNVVKTITDVSQTWDGTTTSGTVCKDGVYFYVGNTAFNNGKEDNVKGFINLFR